MLIYPQLGTGALTQFPVQKRRRLRTVINAAADGSSVKLADPNGEYTEWTLQYAGLSDTEVSALQQFFAAAEGTLNDFTFLDPTGNLLAWSDDLTNSVWAPGPQLGITGGPGAWHLINPGGGPQSLSQTLNAPAGYQYCFSAYVRSSQTAPVTMLIGSRQSAQPVTSDFTRIVFSAAGDPAQSSLTFGLQLPPGGAIDAYGFQVEAQAAPSVYKVSTIGGVYESARLGDDGLTVTTTGVNQNSCTVRIYHAKHL
jgi:hypothetical protein